MARLPIYNNGANISVAARAPVPTNPWKDTQQIAQAGMELAVQWQKTQNAAESLDGKNKMIAAANDILTEAEEYRDYQSPKDLQAKEQELQSRMDAILPGVTGGFTNGVNANQFSQEYQLTIAQNSERLKGIFREKYMDNDAANRTISYDNNMKSFITSGNNSYKQSYLADLENSFKAGYISDQEKTAQALKVNDWDQARMLYLADKEPEIVLDGIKRGSYGEISSEAKDAYIKAANKKLKLLEIESKNAQIETEWNLSTRLDSLPTDEALTELLRSEGQVSDKYFKAKREALLSDKGITAKTRADIFQDLLLEIETLDKDDVENYYSGADSVLTKIEDNYAKGYSSTKEYQNLVKNVNQEKAKNIDVLKNDDSNTFMFWGFSYKDASEFIKDNYAGTDGNKLLLDYFTAINGQDLSGSKKKQILEQLIDKANSQAVGYPVFRDVNAAKAAFEKGELKKGAYFYLNGKLQQVN